MIKVDSLFEQKRVTRNGVALLSTKTDFKKIKENYENFKVCLRISLSLISKVTIETEKELKKIARNHVSRLNESIQETQSFLETYSYDLVKTGEDGFISDVSSQMDDINDSLGLVTRDIENKLGVTVPTENITKEMVYYGVAESVGIDTNNTMLSKYLGFIDMTQAMGDLAKSDENIYNEQLDFIKSREASYVYRYTKYLEVLLFVMNNLQEQYESLKNITKAHRLAIDILDHLTKWDRTRTNEFVSQNNFSLIESKTDQFFEIVEVIA